MYQPAYKCHNSTCKGCVRIENTYCEPCYVVARGDALMPLIDNLVCRSRLGGPNGEHVAVALMQEYAA